MTETLPISVVIPAYNREDMLPRALRAVAGQRPRLPAEVIVVDDASGDKTGDIARQLGARVIVRKTNGGAAASRNDGVYAATQEWIAFLDSDDEWLPHLLDTLWHLRGGHVLVTGASLSLGGPEDGRVGGVPSRDPTILSSPAPLVFPGNFVASSGVLVRRSILLDAGGYRTDLRMAEDFALWLRVLERGTGLATSTVVSLYHRHDAQKSNLIDAGRAAQARAIAGHSTSPWYSDQLVERRAVVNTWDDLRAGRVSRRSAVGVLAGSPNSLRALISILVWRARQRRRSSRVTREGATTLAVLPGVVGRFDGDEVVDLRDQSLPRVLLRLARRPTSNAIVRSRLSRVALRALGIHAERA